MSIAEIASKALNQPQHSSVTESPIEEKMVGALQRFGINPNCQQQIGPYRADIVIESKYNKIVVECDGTEFHKDKAKDDIRDEYMREKGYIVYRFTGSQINRNAEACAAKVIEDISEIYQMPAFQRYLEIKSEKVEDEIFDDEEAC